MKPKFNTDFEYDEWFEQSQDNKLLDDYFGQEVDKNERNKITSY